jgi:hypothetical protein
MTEIATLEQRLTRTFHQVAADTAIPPTPTPTPAARTPTPVRHRRRAAVLAASVAITVLAGGYGTAVATGVLDGPLAFWGFDTANPDTAQILGEFAVPGGSTVRAEIASARDGQVCFAFRVLPQQDSRPPNEGGGCTASATSRFAGNGASVGIQQFDGSPAYEVFTLSAGSATSAELLGDGQTRPLLVKDGWIVGWTPLDGPADVVAYDGTVVLGRVPVPSATK